MSNAAAELATDPAPVGNREQALELLRDALRVRGMSANQLARELGTSSGLVSRWFSGKRWPGLKHALLIEQQFGIPAHLWIGSRQSHG